MLRHAWRYVGSSVMKVWIAIGSWHYQGYHDPIGVYSTPELAQKALDLNTTSYDDREVMEYQIDNPKTLEPPQPE